MFALLPPMFRYLYQINSIIFIVYTLPFFQLHVHVLVVAASRTEVLEIWNNCNFDPDTGLMALADCDQIFEVNRFVEFFPQTEKMLELKTMLTVRLKKMQLTCEEVVILGTLALLAPGATN